MSDLMYYCASAALGCSLSFAWTIITLIKSTSLEESGQRQKEEEGEAGREVACVCVSIFCISVCVCILVCVHVSVYMQVTTQNRNASTGIFALDAFKCIESRCSCVAMCSAKQSFLMTRKTEASAAVHH